MPRLIFHGEGDAVIEIVLQPGVNRLGRDEDNDQPLEHDSISGHHCEIQIGPDGALVRDLQSTNGTFIDGEPIIEARLHPGQTLQLGEVPMIYAEDPRPVSGVRVRTAAQAPTAARVAGAVPAPAPSVPAHPGRRGRTRRQGTTPPPTFFAALPGAFSYPFKRNGLILLICGTVFFGLLEVAQIVLGAFMVGFFAFAFLVAWIMSVGYMFAFMQNIIVSSTNGEGEMPAWPEISGFYDDILVPCFRLMTIGAACCGPGLLAIFLISPVVGVALVGLGLFCLPMALLTVSLADSVAGLNPLIIFSGIAKVPVAYIVTCVVFLLAVATMSLIDFMLEVSGIPLLPAFVGWFASLYLITVEMRILGLLYYTHRQKLAWFD